MVATKVRNARLSDKVFAAHELIAFKDIIESKLGAKFDYLVHEGGSCGSTLFECQVSYSKPDGTDAEWERILDFCKESGFKVL